MNFVNRQLITIRFFLLGPTIQNTLQFPPQITEKQLISKQQRKGDKNLAELKKKIEDAYIET